MVEVEGHKIHIFAQGEGQTIVITGGLGTPSPFIDFYRIVDGLSKNARAVVYERPGYGWSESAKTPRTTEQITLELYELLKMAGENPPFVFVAHSFGSLEVIRFAQKYPDLVAGILFVDAGNPGFYQDYNIEQIKVVSYIVRFISKIGLIRITGDIADLLGIVKMSGLPEEIKKRAKMMFYSNWFNNDSIRELDLFNKSAATVMEAGTLGDIPLTILTAEKSTHNIKGWLESQQELSRWSTKSQHKIVDNAGHGMPVTHSDVVVRETLALSQRIAL